MQRENKKKNKQRHTVVIYRFAMKFVFALSCLCCAVAIINTIGLLPDWRQKEWIHVLLQVADNEAVKNISMTVGLTGVLFTWILQFFEMKVCSQPMSRLLSFVFKQYRFQLAIFFVSLIVSIGFSSLEDSGDCARLIYTSAFASMLLGLINMWLLCNAFLFSEEKRRKIAFAYLADQISKCEGEDDNAKKLWAFECWLKEIPTCICENDEANIQLFFRYLMEGYQKNSMPANWHQNIDRLLMDLVSLLDDNVSMNQYLVKAILQQEAKDALMNKTPQKALINEKQYYLAAAYMEVWIACYVERTKRYGKEPDLLNDMWQIVCVDSQEIMKSVAASLFAVQISTVCARNGNMTMLEDAAQLLKSHPESTNIYQMSIATDSLVAVYQDKLKDTDSEEFWEKVRKFKNVILKMMK